MFLENHLRVLSASIFILLLSSNVIADTSYEDAETGTTAGWDIYDNDPTGAIISNVFDAEKNSKVIEFVGAATSNGYRLGHNSASNVKAWGNTAEKVISWESKYTESFVVYIGVETAQGFRYLYYTPRNNDLGIHTTSSKYIHHGVGSKVRNGAWHTISRDLEADLQEFEPTNTITSVNGFLIRGSGRVDNIVLLNELPPLPPIPSETIYEDAEDTNIEGWDVYDSTPGNASISNLADTVKNSRVIEFSGSGTSNGYRLGHNSANNIKAWGNIHHKLISWDSNFDESMVVYIATETTQGFRYLYYTFSNSDNGIHATSSKYIHHGISTSFKDGEWHTINRNLEADLKDFEPTNELLSVNGFLIRGSGRVDNIKTENDADNDGIADNTDTDDDNDGVLDIDDAFPLDPNESVDTDSDGIGNNTDLDDDGDGFSDVEEIAAGSDPLDANSKPEDTTPPVITVIGSDVSIEQGTIYVDEGATAIDDRDGVVDVIATGLVDVTSVGSYTITYTATDSATNSTTVTRTVEVTAPNVQINVLSPSPNSSVEYSYITLQIEANNIANVEATNNTITGSTGIVGVRSGDTFLIHNVGLLDGLNEVVLSANDGGVSEIINITSEGKGFAPIVLTLDQNKSFGSLSTTATINHKNLTVVQYMVDIDGDKVIDIVSDTATQQLNFPAVGAYRPSAVIKTAENILYSSIGRYNETVNILDNPELQNTNVPTGNVVYDLEEFGEHIYALLDTTVVKINKQDSSITEVINLPNFTNPRGLTLDGSGNIFIADTGADRVAILLASNGYQVFQGFSIDTSGNGDGELLSPMDVSVSDQGIFVLDSGNNRVQLFNYSGQYVTQFNGSTTPQGTLNSPLNMIGAPDLIITDSGNNIVRKLKYNDLSGTIEGSLLASIYNIGKVTYSSNGITVPDNTNNKILYLYNNGELISSLPTSQPNIVALSYEQNHQLLYMSQGSTELKHLYIDKTAPNVAPKALAEKFIQAFLISDNKTMLRIGTHNWINRLKRQDAKAREAFSNIVSYNENIYMHGLKAVVFVKSQVTEGEVNIKFYFSWVNGRWLLTKII